MVAIVPSSRCADLTSVSVTTLKEPKKYTLEISYGRVAIPCTVWERFCNWIGQCWSREYRFIKTMKEVHEVEIPVEGTPTASDDTPSTDSTTKRISAAFNRITRKIEVQAANPSEVANGTIKCKIVNIEEPLTAEDKVLQGKIEGIIKPDSYPPSCRDYIRNEYIPTLIRLRKKALAQQRGQTTKGIVQVSSKSSGLHFKYSGKGADEMLARSTIRILPDETTLITFPGIIYQGGIKKVKPVITISPDASSVEVKSVVAKVQKSLREIYGTRIVELQEEVSKAAATFNHEHVLSPTAIIHHPTRGIEIVSPKCECDFKDFLEQVGKSNPDDTVKVANELISYIENIVSGMEYIYRRGYLHNDLKPENIFFEKVGDHYVPKVADFDSLRTIEWGLTNTIAIGTTGYFLSTTNRKDLQSEFYALGQIISFVDAPGSLPISVKNVLDALMEKEANKFGDDSLAYLTLQNKCTRLMNLARSLRESTIADFTALKRQLADIKASEVKDEADDSEI